VLCASARAYLHVLLLMRNIRPTIVIFAVSVLSACLGCQSDSVSSERLSVADGQAPARCRALMRHLRHIPTVKSLQPWQLPDFIVDPCACSGQTEPRKGSATQNDEHQAAHPKNCRGASACGLKITTRHYLIYTTVEDPLILRQVPMLMESAFAAYSQGADLPDHVAKLVIYLFGSREHWEQFTRHWVGAQAPLYLQIRAGAYYLHGTCVAYQLNRQTNYSVLAHEGWHQFSDQFYKSHLPAWVDEGLATNFEAYQWQDGQVAFQPAQNGARLFALRQALATGTMYHLSELLQLEPGGVLTHGGRVHSGESNPKIAAYYAQVYALVRFLREDDYGRYLRRFRTMLGGAQRGDWPLPAELLREALQPDSNPTRRWNALVGPWAFQSYIAATPAEVEPAYLDFCRKILATVRFKKTK